MATLIKKVSPLRKLLNRIWVNVRKPRHIWHGPPIFYWDEKAHLGIIFHRWEFSTFSLPYGVVCGAVELKTPADQMEFELCGGCNIDWERFEFDGFS